LDRTINPAAAALSAVIADVANNHGVKPREIEVKYLTAHQWWDSCLELPKDDEMCTDAITPGNFVSLGDWLRYRTDQQGNVRREEAPIECAVRKAWLDLEPPTPPRSLHVTGTYTFPTPGYTAGLRPSDPQGINPWDLLLELVVQAPGGAVSRVLTDVEIHYEAEAETECKTVTIFGSPSVLVEHAV